MKKGNIEKKETMKNRISEKEKKQGKERIVKKILFFQTVVLPIHK